ncbi:hypothetical protein [Bradyrhizobium betae]|uniref:hypothetical protein n=1 Tax=Bradyrhizobium betae TaxID=244734 RepID=UPI00100E699E|nr:hypothetical protein [Bradyrhizobium betae]
MAPDDDHIPYDHLVHEQQIDHVQVENVDHAAALVHDSLVQQIHEELIPHDPAFFDHPLLPDPQTDDLRDSFHPQDDPAAIFDQNFSTDASTMVDHDQLNGDGSHLLLPDDPTVVFDPNHHDDPGQIVEQGHHDEASAAATGTGNHEHVSQPPPETAGHHGDDGDGYSIHDPFALIDPSHAHLEISTVADISHVEEHPGGPVAHYDGPAHLEALAPADHEDPHATGAASEHLDNPASLFEHAHDDDGQPIHSEPSQVDDPLAVFNPPGHEDVAGLHGTTDVHEGLQQTSHHEQDPLSVFDSHHDTPANPNDYHAIEELHQAQVHDELVLQAQHAYEAHVLADQQIQDDHRRRVEAQSQSDDVHLRDHHDWQDQGGGQDPHVGDQHAPPDHGHETAADPSFEPNGYPDTSAHYDPASVFESHATSAHLPLVDSAHPGHADYEQNALFAEIEKAVDNAKSRTDSWRGLAVSQMVVHIDEYDPVSRNPASWDDPSQKHFQEAYTNMATKHDLTQTNQPPPLPAISLRDAERLDILAAQEHARLAAAGQRETAPYDPDEHFRKAALGMLVRRFSEVVELRAIHDDARSRIQNLNRPYRVLANDLNNRVWEQIAQGATEEARLVQRALDTADIRRRRK